MGTSVLYSSIYLRLLLVLPHISDKRSSWERRKTFPLKMAATVRSSFDLSFEFEAIHQKGYLIWQPMELVLQQRKQNMSFGPAKERTALSNCSSHNGFH
jgi:hypothetical protein